MRSLFATVFLFLYACTFSLSAQNFFTEIKESDLKSSLFYEEKKKDPNETTFDNRGLMFGLNLGMLKSNGYNANYYNGSSKNVNTINYILNNQYYYNDIRRELNNRDFELYELPSQMKFDLTLSVGFYLRYLLNQHNGFFIQFNYAKLSTNDVFTLKIDSANFTSEPSLRLYNIYGQEERTYIDFGFHHENRLGNKTNWFIETGFNINSTKVLKSGITIGSLDYSIINVYGSQGYVPGSGVSPYSVTQTGIGYGFFGTAGIRLLFNEYVSIDPYMSLYYQRTGLDGYSDFKLSYTFMVRILLRNFL